MGQLALVTGAGGFIGSHLVELLVKNGYSVRAFVHYNSRNDWGWLDNIENRTMCDVEVIQADICDEKAVRRSVADCCMVFHLAALISIPYSYIAPSSYVDINIKGTLNVLQACLDEQVERLVHTSTSETYGTAQYVPIDEMHPLVGQSPYSASKIAADKLAEAFNLSYNLPVTIIRPFNTYGPRQSARGVIPTIIMQALAEVKRINLGALSPVRDFTYVKDTVCGFMAAALENKAIGEVINIGGGEGIAIRELAEMTLKFCCSDAKIYCEKERVRPEKSEVMKLICDNNKARKLLDWSPKYSFKHGLKETVSWMKGHLHHYKSYLYNI